MFTFKIFVLEHLLFIVCFNYSEKAQDLNKALSFLGDLEVIKICMNLRHLGREHLRRILFHLQNFSVLPLIVSNG